MEKAKPIRLIDGLGRIALPVDVRLAMDWGENTPVEIRADAEAEQVIIKRHTRTCVFCGETADLKQLGKKYICPACQKKIAAL